MEGVLFCWRIQVFVEERCVLISRRGSSASGVGRGSYFAGKRCILIPRRGSISSGVGVTYFCWRIKERCVLISRSLRALK